MPAEGAGRIDYVDLVKGLTILWIIWYHSYYFSAFGNAHNYIFFFISGAFFKVNVDTRSFFAKRVKMILIPYLFFFITGAALYTLVMGIYEGSFVTLRWDLITDIFLIQRHDGMHTPMPPLWFLKSLLIIQSLCYFIYKLPKWGIWGFMLAMCCVQYSGILSQVPDPLDVFISLYYIIFFTLGYLVGRDYIIFLSSRRKKLFAIVAVCAVWIMLWIAIAKFNLREYVFIIHHGKALCGVFGMIAVMSFFDGKPCMNFLRFFGKNTLPVLGLHLWILLPLQFLWLQFSDMRTPGVGLLLSVLTALLLAPIIRICNAWIPDLIGARSVRFR